MIESIDPTLALGGTTMPLTSEAIAMLTEADIADTLDLSEARTQAPIGDDFGPTDPLYMPPNPGGEPGEPMFGDIVVTGIKPSDNWAVYSFNLFIIEANMYSQFELTYDYAPGIYGLYYPRDDPNHVNNDHLDSSGKFDLTDTTEIYKFLGNNQIKVVIDNKTVPADSVDVLKLLESIDRLAANFSSLTLEAQAALAALDYIVVAEPPVRSFAEVNTDSFFLDYDQLAHPQSSVAFVSSIIIHDAAHILLHDMNQDWNFYSGDHGEGYGYDLEYYNRAATGLSEHEISVLNTYRSDPSLDDARTAQSPYPNP